MLRASRRRPLKQERALFLSLSRATGSAVGFGPEMFPQNRDPRPTGRRAEKRTRAFRARRLFGARKHGTRSAGRTRHPSVATPVERHKPPGLLRGASRAAQQRTEARGDRALARSSLLILRSSVQSLSWSRAVQPQFRGGLVRKYAPRVDPSLLPRERLCIIMLQVPGLSWFIPCELQVFVNDPEVMKLFIRSASFLCSHQKRVYTLPGVSGAQSMHGLCQHFL